MPSNYQKRRLVILLKFEDNECTSYVNSEFNMLEHVNIPRIYQKTRFAILVTFEKKGPIMSIKTLFCVKMLDLPRVYQKTRLAILVKFEDNVLTIHVIV